MDATVQEFICGTCHYGDLCTHLTMVTYMYVCTHSSGREKLHEPMCRGWNVASVNTKEPRDQPECTEGAEISRNAVFALVQASVVLTIALPQACVCVFVCELYQQYGTCMSLSL